LTAKQSATTCTAYYFCALRFPIYKQRWYWDHFHSW